MNEDIYQDKYRATIPKIIDYGCIAVAMLSFFSLMLSTDVFGIR